LDRTPSKVAVPTLARPMVSLVRGSSALASGRWWTKRRSWPETPCSGHSSPCPEV